MTRLTHAVPIEWHDLAPILNEATLSGSTEQPCSHLWYGGDYAEVVCRRGRPVALAWKSGKVTVDTVLVSQPLASTDRIIDDALALLARMEGTP